MMSGSILPYMSSPANPPSPQNVESVLPSTSARRFEPLSPRITGSEVCEVRFSTQMPTWSSSESTMFVMPRSRTRASLMTSMARGTCLSAVIVRVAVMTISPRSSSATPGSVRSSTGMRSKSVATGPGSRMVGSGSSARALGASTVPSRIVRATV